MKKLAFILLILAVAFATEEDFLPGAPSRDRCPRPTPRVPKCRYYTNKKSFGNVASWFNLFVRNDFQCQSTDTQGRVAVGGNMDARNYDIGCLTYSRDGVNCRAASCPAIDMVGHFPHALVVGGDLSYNNGEISSGSVVYGGSFSGNGWTLRSDGCGAPSQGSPIDFDESFGELIKTSALLAGLPTTGQTLFSGGIVFEGTNDENLEVFEVSADQLAAAHTIKFSNINQKATIIVNCIGSSFSIGGKGIDGIEGKFEHNLLWNFPTASSLELFNIKWFGSILAPLADMLTDFTGQINGAVYVKSYKSKNGEGCFQINWYEFWGCVPDDEPEIPPPGNVCVDPFGPIASGYNTFMLQHYYCVNSDVEGRVAAGGNIFVRSWAGGCQIYPAANGNCLNMGEKHCSDLTADGQNEYAVVAGINLDMKDTEVKVGHVAYGFEINSESSTIASDCQQRKTDGVVDFGKAFAYLNCLSRTLKKLRQTGRYTNEYNQLVLYGSGADTEVFNIDGIYLSAARSFEIKNVKDKATIVINVGGAENLPIGNMEFFPVGSFPSQYIVWNFYEATTLRFYSVGWRGTILAPNALIADGGDGVIHGQIFARTWEQKTQCIQVNWVPFKGCLPDCDSTPQPPIVGCADGEREGFTDPRQYPCIAACQTKWTVPGVIGKTATCQRQAGDDITSQPDGCSVEDACAPGWHVCRSQAEVNYAFRREGTCRDAGAGFYLSQVSGPGCGICAVEGGENTECTGGNCQRECAPNSQTRNDLFGCGSLTRADGILEEAEPDPETCGPFNLFSNNLCQSVPGLYCGNADGLDEADIAVKSEYPGGGVLCCADQCVDRTDNPEGDDEGPIIL